jgi:hypothetical protein
VEPLPDRRASRLFAAELQMDLAFVALGAVVFIAFGVYAALLKRV